MVIEPGGQMLILAPESPSDRQIKAVIECKHRELHASGPLA
jgi:hypothetical protein